MQEPCSMARVACEKAEWTDTKAVASRSRQKQSEGIRRGFMTRMIALSDSEYRKAYQWLLEHASWRGSPLSVLSARRGAIGSRTWECNVVARHTE